jgi:hypothetical protein
MRTRNLKAALLAGAFAVLLTPAIAQAQIMGAYSAPDWEVVPGYKAPRTSWGKPDISGNWTNSTLTPVSRPREYGDRLVLTKEETAKLENASNELIELGNRPTDPNATVKDLPADCSGNRGTNCNYNAAFTDPGSVVMRVNGQPRSSLLTTADGQFPARKSGAAAAPATRGGRLPAGVRQNDNPEGRSLGERCILSFGRSAGPPMFDQLYNSNYQFVMGKDHLAINVEMVHDVRTIPIYASKAVAQGQHRKDNVRPWFGDPVAWWEGETLVVETTHIPQGQQYQGAWENLTVTERFTRVSPSRMNYKFEIRDPTMWDAAWGGEYEFGKATGDVYEYACHEGNYGLQNILAGARAEDEEEARTGRRPPQVSTDPNARTYDEDDS